jgi:secreted PhoX family phosphatase
MNHENVTAWALHAEGGTSPSAGPRPKAEVDREMAAHGISVVEVQKRFGAFQVNRRSKFNRRITTATPFDLRGPVRGHALAVTKYSPGGTATRGTVNNCGTGITPWGTLLSGEENWASYAFRAAGDDAARGGSTAKSVVALKRYGNEEGPSRFAKRWDSAGDEDSYARWNGSVLGDDAATDYRNVLNTYGYMVEVDPYDPTSTPVKRTALGRFAHEGATFAPARAGQPLVAYMGDDSRGEYIYKFVSKAPWSERDREPRSRMSVGHKYLDEGTLYAAKFNEDGTGEWVELSLNNPAVRNFSGYAFEDEADVLVHARIAADAAGATRMDRPEWCSVNPKNGEVYFTLTNNSRRTPEATDSANPRSYDDTFGTGESARTQTGNVHGHIIRMAERKGDSAARAFAWDVYLFGAEATSDPERVNLSGLTDDNDFSSPDGLWFSHATGICWIQTDDGAYTDVTNCMLLAALPGKVGDGRPTTLTYGSEGASSRTVTTPAGAVATAATVRRFLVGPVECEITGITETPDGRALFVNIQHPGEDTNPAYARNPLKYTSHWPDGGYARPRSATIVITKDDGGVIGS